MSDPFVPPLGYRPVPDLLQDRVILITGAGSGIGREAALSFAAHGATVVLLGRTVGRLEQVYDAIEAAGHPQAAIYPLNLEGATPADYAEMAARLREAFGRLDGLLHNAAAFPGLAPLIHHAPEVWQRVLQVNLTGPFYLTQACLPLLMESADASVLFTSADVGRRAKAYWGAYGVSKHALEGLSRTWAEELEANAPVRVNTLDPGPVRTRLRALAYPGRDPLDSPEPERIMDAYLYLIGPDSKGTSGQAFTARRRAAGYPSTDAAPCRPGQPETEI